MCSITVAMKSTLRHLENTVTNDPCCDAFLASKQRKIDAVLTKFEVCRSDIDTDGLFQQLQGIRKKLDRENIKH